MSVEIKETSATVRTLEITIPQADLTAPYEKKLGQYKKQVSMKGFRQGMVPKAMILKQFGDAIRHEAVDEVVNKLDQSERTIPVSGVFIAVGIAPRSEFARNHVAMDEKGYIIADETGTTSVPGVFAAGDVRTKQLRQVVTAVADGANAVTSVEKYLLTL